ncbi:MAG: hypothetical protein ACXWK8_04865, partial [Myxococcaceae bacterium]
MGATRLIGRLAADAVHVLFPDGRDLRLRGVLVEQKLVVVSPPGVQFDRSTQVEGCGFDLVVRGASFASPLETEEALALVRVQRARGDLLALMRLTLLSLTAPE